MTDQQPANGRYRDVDPIRERWKAQPNDLIGGWCITLDEDRTLGEGAYEVGDFFFSDVAEHVVKLHNDWLNTQT